MTEPSSATESRAPNLRAVIERITAESLADCTQCGKCFEVCPMPAYSTKLGDAAASEVVGGVLGILRGAAGSAASLEWVRLCTGSARCIPACPEGVNPMLMLRVARFKALGSLGDAPQMTLPEDPHYFRKVHAFASLHFTDEEIDAWQR
jgi:Fe-S oxidoreductase